MFKRRIAVLGLFTAAGLCQAQGPKALFISDGTGLSDAVINYVTPFLSNQGFTVSTNVGLPGGGLGSFQQVWDVRVLAVLSGPEIAAELAFLQGGGSLFLMGENSAFLPRDNSMAAFVATAGGGVINAADAQDAQTVQPPFTGPVTALAVNYLAAGGSTTAGTGSFVTRGANGLGSAIVWAPGTLANAPAGALMVFMDFNALQGQGTGFFELIGNMITYLAAPTPISALTVTGVSPASGPVGGGNTVSITGLGFTGATAVRFGSSNANSFTVNSDTQISAVVPPGSPGPANVVVTTPAGSSAPKALYRYGTPGYSITSYPDSLNVQYQLGTPFTGGQQILSIGETAGSYQWTATASDAGWITLGNTVGGTPSTLSVIINPAGLAAGVYNATIRVSANGASVTVPVTLTVLAPAAITVNPAAISLSSSVSLHAGPSSFDVRIAGPAGAPFSIAQGSPSQGWISVTPASGTAPATVRVTLDSTGANTGIYYGSLAISSPMAANSPVTVPVTMSVGGFFTPPPVVSAASWQAAGTVSSNEALAVFLPNIGCAGTPEVALNGVAAVTLGAAGGQINFATPPGATAGALTVKCGSAAVWRYNGLAVAAAVPALFSQGQSGIGAALSANADGGFDGANPVARPGDVVNLYGTGFGEYSSAGADGLRHVAATVTASIGGAPATVLYAGEAAGSNLGITRITLQIPGSIAAGTVPVAVSVAGFTTQSGVTLAVR